MKTALTLVSFLLVFTACEPSLSEKEIRQYREEGDQIVDGGITALCDGIQLCQDAETNSERVVLSNLAGFFKPICFFKDGKHRVLVIGGFAFALILGIIISRAARRYEGKNGLNTAALCISIGSLAVYSIIWTILFMIPLPEI